MPSQSPAVEATVAHVRRARPLLGTIVEIGITSRGAREHLHSVIDTAFEVIEEVQALMSYQDPNSELSRINRDAVNETQRVDAHTYRVLEAALRFARLSEGAFDPCVAHCLEAWGYLPRGEAAVDALPSWRDILLVDGECVRFLRPLRLDLGGIAKGYAVDRAVRSLQQSGIQDIVVNAGGDLRVAGDRPRAVHLRHPQTPARLAQKLMLQEGAIATSAAYYSRRQMHGREVSALVNSHTGEAYVGNRSVSVRAEDCITADALTKVVMFASDSATARTLTMCRAEAYLLDADPADESGERPRITRQSTWLRGFLRSSKPVAVTLDTRSTRLRNTEASPNANNPTATPPAICRMNIEHLALCTDALTLRRI